MDLLRHISPTFLSVLTLVAAGLPGSASYADSPVGSASAWIQAAPIASSGDAHPMVLDRHGASRLEPAHRVIYRQGSSLMARLGAPWSVPASWSGTDRVGEFDLASTSASTLSVWQDLNTAQVHYRAFVGDGGQGTSYEALSNVSAVPDSTTPAGVAMRPFAVPTSQLGYGSVFLLDQEPSSYRLFGRQLSPINPSASGSTVPQPFAEGSGAVDDVTGWEGEDQRAVVWRVTEGSTTRLLARHGAIGTEAITWQPPVVLCESSTGGCSDPVVDPASDTEVAVTYVADDAQVLTRRFSQAGLQFSLNLGRASGGFATFDHRTGWPNDIRTLWVLLADDAGLRLREWPAGASAANPPIIFTGTAFRHATSPKLSQNGAVWVQDDGTDQAVVATKYAAGRWSPARPIPGSSGPGPITELSLTQGAAPSAAWSRAGRVWVSSLEGAGPSGEWYGLSRSGTRIQVRVRVFDPSGVRNVTFWRRTHEGDGGLSPWRRYAVRRPAGSASTLRADGSFVGRPGSFYCVKMRATDRLGNVGDWIPLSSADSYAGSKTCLRVPRG